MHEVFYGCGRQVSDRLAESALADEVEFLTARARSVGTARANAALRELDLKVRSYSVLALAASGLNPTQRELAGFLVLDASQIVALVDELEARKLVARTPDPADRRSNVISATKAGAELFARAREVTRQAEAASLAALDAAEREQLTALLRRVAFE